MAVNRPCYPFRMSDAGLQVYRYRGARALVLMHEREMRGFLPVWRRARAAGTALPKTDDPSFESLQTLLLHVLRCPRSYMVWICEKLGLPGPGIDEPPPVERIERDADSFLSHVLERWRSPLAAVEEKRFDEVFPSRWGVQTSVESMLEHAVVHPMRHVLQLEELMGGAR
jgi:uncharacterized damage-inducible protein DinB